MTFNCREPGVCHLSETSQQPTGRKLKNPHRPSMCQPLSALLGPASHTAHHEFQRHPLCRPSRQCPQAPVQSALCETSRHAMRKMLPRATGSCRYSLRTWHFCLLWFHQVTPIAKFRGSCSRSSSLLSCKGATHKCVCAWLLLHQLFMLEKSSFITSCSESR